MMINDDFPLVSVCIITYNSSNTILETLDSVLAQTYPHLELLVSDDCSSDDTISICRSWFESHGSHFERVELLIREKNGGVAANLNTVINAAKGEWLKTLAGDDILLPDCVSNNIEYINHNENDGIVFFYFLRFYVNDKNEKVHMYYMPNPYVINYYSESADLQYQRFLLYNFTPTASVFVKRSLAVKHPYLERYRYCEDWPYWMHLTKNGIALRYFDKLTVMYRSGQSLSIPGKETFVNPKFHQSMMGFFYSERYHNISETNVNEAKRQQKEYFLGEVAIILLKNRKNLLTRIILFVFKMIIGTRKVL